MQVSANFAFLAQEFPHAAESASFAEHHVHGDPRASCFHARHALERLVKRIYKVDRSLTPPKVTNLDSYLSDPAFRELVPEVVWQKAEYVRQVGNVAVHGNKPPTADQALAVVQELFHLLYWAGRTYLRKGAEQLEGLTYDESQILKASGSAVPVSIPALEDTKASLDASDAADPEDQQELDAIRDQLASIKAQNEAVPETHNWNEAKTRELLIDLALRRAGWALDQKRDRECEVTGMPNAKGLGYVDYVLWGDDGKPLAVVEAKKTSVDPRVGQQQAKLYADCLEQMHGQRPVIFYTNGYTNWIWDDLAYPPRNVAGFYSKTELTALILRRTLREKLDVSDLKNHIVERYYQKRAIGSIAGRFTESRRKALLVMATGSGKTRTAIALVDLLQRAGWVKRALFLADRVSLVNQAVGAFKAHLPEASPVNLVTERNGTGRVFVCTYPTMMGLIDEVENGTAKMGIGHFDLVIIDEAHRSVYQKYGAIFRYFDSLLVGLTATPRDQVDRNTYQLFDLEPGMPTDAYELETAVADGFLVPQRVQQVDLKFPREGIEYDSLSEEEKAQWEGLDWGDDAPAGELPDRVNATAINSWLFNKDTVDKALKYVMEHGHKVDGGDRLAKTIIFARNHDHALFIEDRFNHHYPEYKGHFARVIDHYANYPQSLLDSFSQKENEPHLAISVDMLDTGIDVPEVANLVFFKPVYSKIKFWQMIGRGTRLCPDLFGPGRDKQDFRVFDFCFNFDFFQEHPDGIEANRALPLSARLFQGRVELLATIQDLPDLDPASKLSVSLIDGLHAEMSAMNRENFIVREHLASVDRFRNREVWQRLTYTDRKVLNRDLSTLPTQTEPEQIEARQFDLTLLRMQLALAQGKSGELETRRQRVMDIARMLEERSNIPVIRAQLAYLAELQTASFWEGIDLSLLEEVRLRLRGLVHHIDKTKRKIIYTDFEDEIVDVRLLPIGNMPKMTGVEYEKKVKEFLSNHEDHMVVQRLRRNEPLTETDLQGLERALTEIGEDEGEGLLTSLLARSQAPSLAHFVRKLVGFDRAAAQAAFSEFLNDRSLTAPQIRFVEMVIDQLTNRGVIEASALYEAPFSAIHGEGPDALFAGRPKVIGEIFNKLKAVEEGLVPRAG